MAKRHALIIPAICPVDQYSTNAPSILDYDVYWELKHAALHRQLLTPSFRYLEKRKRILMGAFGVLRESYEGHTIVFLHPHDVLTTLNAKIVMLSGEGVDITDLGGLTKQGIRSGRKLNDFLANQWHKGSILIISDHIAEVAVDNLTIQHKPDDLYMVRYCYGRVTRVVNRMDIDMIISSSRLIAMPHKVSDPLEKADMLLKVLMYYPPRWPWMNYGLVIDKSRRWVTMLNPDVMNLIEVNNLEELRVMDYVEPRGWEGNYVPIIVVKKLTLIPPQLNDYSSRLENVLWRSVQRFKTRVRGGVWLLDILQ